MPFAIRGAVAEQGRERDCSGFGRHGARGARVAGGAFLQRLLRRVCLSAVVHRCGTSGAVGPIALGGARCVLWGGGGAQERCAGDTSAPARSKDYYTWG